VRKVLSALLIVLACVLVPLGGLSAWAKYEIGDTGRYVDTMAPLAAGPDVQSAIADSVTDGVMNQIEVGPLEGEVRAYVRRAVRSFTGTEAFRAAWNTANRAAHDAVLRALRSGREGAVTLDLAPVTEQLKSQLSYDRVPLANRIPVEHTEVTVLQAQELSTLRKGFHVLEIAGFWLPLAAVALAVGGILLAVRRRRPSRPPRSAWPWAPPCSALATVIGRALTLADLPPCLPGGGGRDLRRADLDPSHGHLVHPGPRPDRRRRDLAHGPPRATSRSVRSARPRSGTGTDASPSLTASGAPSDPPRRRSPA
jgi:hypothetical protein